MHDFLEGTLVHNMGHLLNQLKIRNILPFEVLISKMASFEYGRIDASNKLSKEPFKIGAYTNPKGSLLILLLNLNNNSLENYSPF